LFMTPSLPEILGLATRMAQLHSHSTCDASLNSRAPAGGTGIVLRCLRAALSPEHGHIAVNSAVSFSLAHRGRTNSACLRHPAVALTVPTSPLTGLPNLAPRRFHATNPYDQRA
jgi:hypothetical protein